MIIVEPIHVFLSKNSIDRSKSDFLYKIEELKRNYKLHFDMNTGPWVAGGSVLKFVEGKKIGKRDIDIFFNSKEHFDDMRTVLDSVATSEEWKNHKNNRYNQITLPYGDPPTPSELKNIYKTSAAYTYSLDTAIVQIIRRRYYNNVVQLLGDFDFTVCMFATDGYNIAYPQIALDDVCTSTLRLQRVHRDSVLIKRWYKYILNGYTPAPGQTKLMHEIVREEPERYSGLSNYTRQL